LKKFLAAADAAGFAVEGKGSLRGLKNIPVFNIFNNMLGADPDGAYFVYELKKNLQLLPRISWSQKATDAVVFLGCTPPNMTYFSWTGKTKYSHPDRPWYSFFMSPHSKLPGKRNHSPLVPPPV
jgi:hypothetical protein